MDNPGAREALWRLQREVVGTYMGMAIPSQASLPGRGERAGGAAAPDEAVVDSPPRLQASTVTAALDPIFDEISAVARREEQRLGGDVTAVCLQKYTAMERRWRTITELPTVLEESRNMQPVANMSWGIDRSGEGGGVGADGNPIGSKGSDTVLARLEHLVCIAKGSNSHFARQIALVVGAVNDAANAQELGLDAKAFPLPLRSGKALQVDGQRVQHRIGPLKGLSRARVKAEEYSREMETCPEERPASINGLPVSPADFVIDFLRATLEVEDPYLVAVLFHVLSNRKHATCLRLCRVKNKFMDEELEPHIRTNLLLNLELLYPLTEEAFIESSMPGSFDASLVGQVMAVVEVQITMRLFLKIKKLQHKYYSITRAERDELPALLLNGGAFIDPNNMAQVVPQVVLDMAQKEHGASAAAAPTPDSEEALRTAQEKIEQLEQLLNQKEEEAKSQSRTVENLTSENVELKATLAKGGAGSSKIHPSF